MKTEDISILTIAMAWLIVGFYRARLIAHELNSSINDETCGVDRFFIFLNMISGAGFYFFMWPLLDLVSFVGNWLDERNYRDR